MQMTVGEIKRSYDHAKDKNRQVRILADLNCCTEDQILTILDVETNRNREPEQKSSGADVAVQVLYGILDELESEIRNLEEEYRSVKTAIDVLMNRKENHGKETPNKAGNNRAVQSSS